MSCPMIPIVKKPAHPTGAVVIPQRTDVFFNSPRPAYFQIHRAQFYKLFTAIFRNIFFVTKPQIFAAFQDFLFTSHQFLIFFLTNLVYRFRHYAGYMVMVKNNLLFRLWNTSFGSRDIWVPHVHGNRLNPGAFFKGVSLIIRLQAFLPTVINYKIHRTLIDIVYNRLVFMTTGKRFFVNSYPLRNLMLLTP